MPLRRDAPARGRGALRPAPDRWALTAGLVLALLAGRGVPAEAATAPSRGTTAQTLRVEVSGGTALEAPGAFTDGIVFPGAAVHEVVETTLGAVDSGRLSGSGSRSGSTPGAAHALDGGRPVAPTGSPPLPGPRPDLPAGFVSDRSIAPPAC